MGAGVRSKRAGGAEISACVASASMRTRAKASKEAKVAEVFARLRSRSRGKGMGSPFWMRFLRARVGNALGRCFVRDGGYIPRQISRSGRGQRGCALDVCAHGLIRTLFGGPEVNVPKNDPQRGFFGGLTCLLPHFKRPFTCSPPQSPARGEVSRHLRLRRPPSDRLRLAMVAYLALLLSTSASAYTNVKGGELERCSGSGMALTGCALGPFCYPPT